MDSIANALSRAGSYLTTIGISDFIDILIVAYLIYRVIGFVRKSNFINLAKGVFLLLVALWASEFFGLIMIKYILRRVVELGVIALVIASVFSVVSLVQKLMGVALGGFTTVIILLLLFGSLIMISLGIIGYYIARIYEEIKGRPRYIIQEYLG